VIMSITYEIRQNDTIFNHFIFHASMILVWNGPRKHV
jgi:hypothetical protein